METTDVITVNDMSRQYGSGRSVFEAVRGVSFSVRRGELFALLGTNGAGKTSVLEVLEGLGRLTNHIVAGPVPIRDDVGAQPSESDEVLSTAQGGDWPKRVKALP